MSESDYYAEKESQRLKKHKRTAAEALSDDSEEEITSVPKKSAVSKSVAGASSRKTQKKGKKLQGASSTGASKRNSVVGELFGEEWEEVPQQPTQQPLYSSLSRYLPTGTLRTSQVLEGEFFIELRVFDAAAIKELPYNKRFEEVQAVLRLQLCATDPQWTLVKKIFKEGEKKFEKEPVYYVKEKK